MKKYIKTIFTFTLSLTFFMIYTTKSYAQGVCEFLPCGPDGLLPAPGDPIPTGLAFARYGAGLIFTGFVIVGVGLIVRSGVKIIQSQGDEAKVEEAAKAIKGVFIGIGMLFLGIIGIVVLLAIFSNASFLNEEVPTPEGVEL